MRPALVVFSYAVAVAWVLPLPLRRLSEPGVSPRLGLAATAFAAGIIMILLGWRYGRSLRRASVRTRVHAEAARITGYPFEGREAAFVLAATRPAAYCLPGRPPTIVLTTGALAVLDPEQLTAVLAHERAHLAGRHHLLLAVTRSLAAVAPPFRSSRAEPVRWQGWPRCVPTMWRHGAAAAARC